MAVCAADKRDRDVLSDAESHPGHEGAPFRCNSELLVILYTIWTAQSSSYVATPLLHAGRLYWIDDRGIAYCVSASDGEVGYRERVGNLQSGRPVYSSPTLIGGNIYVVTRRSGTIVYPPGDAFEPIAQNVIAGDETDFNASPAVSEGKIYLRSNQALYCIGR